MMLLSMTGIFLNVNRGLNVTENKKILSSGDKTILQPEKSIS